MGVYKKLDRAMDELKDANVKICDLETDLSIKRAQIEDMCKSAKKAMEAENARRKEISNLKAELEAAKDACDKLRDERDNLAAKLTAKQTEAAALRDKLETTSKELAQIASNMIVAKVSLKHAPFFVRWWTDKHIAEYLK